MAELEDASLPCAKSTWRRRKENLAKLGDDEDEKDLSGGSHKIEGIKVKMEGEGSAKWEKIEKMRWRRWI